MASRLSFIALPAGVAPGGGLRLSTLVVPELDSAERLADTPFADWPARVSSIRFQLRVDAAVHDLADRSADSTLFTQLFPADLPVRTAAPEALTPLFATYAADQMAALAQEVRAEQLAGNQRRLLALRSMLAARRADADLVHRRGIADARGGAEARLRADRVAGRPRFRRLREGPQDEPGLLTDFALFHESAPSGDTLMSDLLPPRLDVHQRVTLLADHPALLRRLGLILDWGLSADTVPAITREIALLPTLPQEMGLAVFAPATAVHRSANRFSAAARQGPHAMLALGAADADGPLFSLTDIDLDAAGHALLRAVAGDSEPGPPRTVGITVLARGRAEALHAADVAASAAMIAQAALCAEDLTRGLRLDVFDEADSRWRSLFARRVDYAPGGLAFAVADEGCLVPSVAQRPQGPQGMAHDPDATGFVSEQLALWAGWSLAAPRPGPAEVPAPEFSNAFLPHQVTAMPGSLPRLRFGSRYRFRARRVDLASNGLGLDEPDPAIDGADTLLPGAGEAHVFRRHEQLPPPVLLANGPADGPGVDTDRLILRDGVAGPDAALRIAPGGVSPLLAEWSGQLDSAFGPGSDPAQMHALAARDALPDPHAAAIALVGCPGVAPGSTLTVGDGAPVVTDAPDADAPGTLIVPLAGVWPDIAGFTLALENGDAPPRFDPASRRLVVFLPPSAVLPLSLRTVPHPDALALLHDVAGSGPLGALLLAGLLPTVAPGRPLRLVHAVAEPTVPSIAALPVPLRTADSPRAFIGADIVFDSATTAGLRLEAEWDNPPDLLPEGAPVPVDRAVLADLPLGADAPLPPHVTRPAPGRVRLGQPGFAAAHAALEAAVSACAAAVARADGVALQSGLPANELDAALGEVLGAAAMRPMDRGWLRVAAPAQSLAGLATSLGTPEPDLPPGFEPTPLALQQAYLQVALAADQVASAAHSAVATLQSSAPAHMFPDARARQLRVRAIATSRFAGDYAPERNTETAGVETRVMVPASSRPPPPRVEDLQPVFFWSRSRGSDGSARATRTTGLRVALARPWLASGPGEMLAMLFGPFLTATRWAADPLVGIAPLPQVPAPRDARGAAQIIESPFSAALYPVQPDSEGRAVATVALDPGATYAPFVQLSLARFQPDALPGMEMSERILADPIALPPNRTLHASAGAVHLTLEGPASEGVAGATDPLGRLPNRVRARVQRLLPGASDDAGWIDAPELGTVADQPAEGALWRGILSRTDTGTTPTRLLVEERETWIGDDLAPSLRLVFAEAILLA
jgi:hypothetical protein